MIDKSVAQIKDPLLLINKITAGINDTQSQELMITKLWNLNSSLIIYSNSFISAS
jgi:hypothetical protein